MKVKPENLKTAIIDQFKAYDFNLRWDMSAASQKRTREGAKWLRKSRATYRNGDYNKAWKTRRTPNGHMIYNTRKPPLTHLLEKGHKKVNDKGWVEGTPHISVVENQVVANFEKDVERIVRESGRKN